MIKLNKYNDECQTICNVKDIEIKCESMIRQNIINLSNIGKDGVSISIEKEYANPHLKCVDINFELVTVSSELLNLYNDMKHKITDIKLTCDLLNFKESDFKNNELLELKNLIMFIDEIRIYDLCKMSVRLKGHMVV